MSGTEGHPLKRGLPNTQRVNNPVRQAVPPAPPEIHPDLPEDRFWLLMQNFHGLHLTYSLERSDGIGATEGMYRDRVAAQYCCVSSSASSATLI